MSKIVLIMITILLWGCNDIKDPYKKKEIQYSRDELIMKRKIDLKKEKIKIATTTMVKNDRDQKLRVKKESLKGYQKHLASQDHKGSKKTLDFLRKHQKRRQQIEKTEHEMGKVNLKTERPKTLFYDEIKMLLPVQSGKFILRNLQFESIPERPFLSTVTFEYIYKKQKISFEILPYRDLYINNVQKGQKDFFYKSFRLRTDLELHLAINTRFEIINGAFTYGGFSWILSSSQMVSSEGILEILKKIKFKQFLKLKKQYELPQNQGRIDE